jgi:hypothetical protein
MRTLDMGSLGCPWPDGNRLGAGSGMDWRKDEGRLSQLYPSQPTPENRPALPSSGSGG